MPQTNLSDPVVNVAILTQLNTPNTEFLTADSAAWPSLADEAKQVAWLIAQFNAVFADRHTILAHSPDEPEYLPASEQQPAQILFAHGFFASALHEISHWCIAGAERRKLPDLGYWYAPDGRSQQQQQLFEQVEVKPQALEWLLTVACGRLFRISLDNLNGDAGNGESFKDAVYQRLQALLNGSAPIPADAQRLLQVLLANIRPKQPLCASEFQRNHL